jgi:hypothetical protein
MRDKYSLHNINADGNVIGLLIDLYILRGVGILLFLTFNISYYKP